MPLGSIKHKWITHLGGIEIDAFHPKKLFLSGKNKGYYLPKERIVPNPLAPGTLIPRADPNFFKGVKKIEYMNHKSKYTGFEYKVERWQIEQIMKKKFGDPETVIISAASLHIPQCIARPCGKYVKPFLEMVYANSIARFPMSVNKVLRKCCFGAAVSLYEFEMLLILRDGMTAIGINPYATTGAIFIDGERYFIPRDDIIVKIDQFLLLPFWIVYEITKPFVEAPVFEQITRFGNFEKVELVRNRRRNWWFYSTYLIVQGK